jgi:leucyl aminopeptidase
MQFTVAAVNGAEANGQLLVIPVFEESLAGKSVPAALQSADAALGGLLLSSATREGFAGKSEESWTFHTHGKIRANQVVLLGLGARAKFDLEALRLAAGRAAKTASKARSEGIAFALPAGTSNEEGCKAAVEGLVLGAYRFDRYRTASSEAPQGSRLEEVQLLLSAENRSSASIKRAVELGSKIAEATNWARNLVNEPAGVLTPARLADEARKAAETSGLKISVGGRKQIQKLKMGMFLGVAQGSAEKPKLIRLSYLPKNRRYAARPSIAFVGKAITFDSGGLSLKTAEGMMDMKTDMAGSAAVLGAMRVIGEMHPPFPVHGFIGACENMPSGTAYRPGDILVSRLGKTVEITNTDAEGRLVLGDVLTWANENKPAAIIDLATLTGACMIALGHYIMGAFGNDESLTRSLLSAAEHAGEQAWRLPISDLQKDALRSEVADMKNSGERWGGAINAAIFLREFVGQTPWVHLDIAGPSTSPKERGYFSKGATGVGVRTLVEFVRRWDPARHQLAGTGRTLTKI